MDLPISNFYKHPKMADGHLGKCKSCARLDVRANRKDKLEYYREYDASRKGVDRHADDYGKRLSAKNPGMHAAHKAVAKAIKDGRIVNPGKCAKCGSPNYVQAHHDDYAKKLDVVWLCPTCHVERHYEIGKAVRMI